MVKLTAGSAETAGLFALTFALTFALIFALTLKLLITP